MDITVKGARANNLQNVDITLPQGKLIVVTGLSGSGKSSLVFDTIFAEGQRRYVESLSSYARQFLGRMTKPDVDYIHGLAPAVAIEQKVNTTNPRSTVGTQTEIYEYLKLLFARIGRTFSPVSGREVKRETVSDVVDYVMGLEEGCRVMILSPLEDGKERPIASQLDILRQEGYQRVMIKGTVVRIEDLGQTQIDGDIYLVVDRIDVRHDDEGQRARVAESVQSAFFEGRGGCTIFVADGEKRDFSNRFEADGITFEKPNVNFFSFNNPYGACQRCGGYGSIIGIDEDLVVPNKSKTVYDGAVVCWKGEKMQEAGKDFIRYAGTIGWPIHKPYYELTEEEKELLWHGDGRWEGIDGFFQWVESQAYKIQYRVMLSRYRGKTVCPDCKGHRLRKDAEYVKVAGKSISELTDMSTKDLAEWIDSLDSALTATELASTDRIRTELKNRSRYLLDVGLGYLTLGRESRSLSGGESQRINLATSLGSSLVGSIYILDEPSIGLHSRDTAQLVEVLKKLRDLGNTVIVVEHDEDIMRAADWLVDIGPGAGRLGGKIVFAGNAKDLNKAKDSLTADYLLGRREIATPKEHRQWRDRIEIRGAYANNLKNIDVEIPLGVFTVVTGVSGSGKSTLVREVLYKTLQQRLSGNPDYVSRCTAMEGDWNRITAVELVDQNPIGRSTRSNPATYMKAFDEIRALFASQPLAKTRGYKNSFFSFNTPGGRCDHCEGEGVITVEMQFMSDVHLTCDECHGKRYKDEALEVKWQGLDISDILELTVDQACELFDRSDTKNVLARLKPLQEVGLGYLKLGQSSSTLSGGEAQRIKLASYLVGGSNSDHPTLFIFDEPSTGLHIHDIDRLLTAFQKLIERGHSIIVIEHQRDIIKSADWVIDLGPEGGENGGDIVFCGQPEQLAKCKQSYTGRSLKL